MKVSPKHQMVSLYVKKILSHFNLFLWMVLCLSVKSNHASYDEQQLDLNEQQFDQELPLQISSPNIAIHHIVASTIGNSNSNNNINNNNNNNNINHNDYNYNEQPKERLFKRSKLFSSAAEILQSIPPPISLANVVGSAFPATSYPVGENSVASSHDMPSTTNQQNVPLRSKRSSSGSHGKSISLVTTHPLDYVCESESRWVYKDIVRDANDNLVRVLRWIDFNGTWVNQYFYETWCKGSAKYEYGVSTKSIDPSKPVAKAECKGIDKNLWMSECNPKWVWAHAKVEAMDGEIGWTWIPLSGSCSCGIRANPNPVNPRRVHFYQKYCARFYDNMSKCGNSNTSEKNKVKYDSSP